MLSTLSLLTPGRMLQICAWIVFIQVHVCFGRSAQTSNLKAGVPSLRIPEYDGHDDSTNNLFLARASESKMSADAKDNRCDAGWIHYNLNCYRVFQKSNERQDWNSAQAECNKLGGNLLSILTYKEQNFVQNNLLSTGVKKSYWIGLNCTSIDDNCRWQGMPTANPYSHRSNRVKDHGVSEMCMEINMRTKFNGLWTSRNCSIKQRFICKKGAKNIKLNSIHRQCGVSYHNDYSLLGLRIKRVIHGTKASDYMVPWQAFIQIKRSDNKIVRCGGSLIDKKYIISAAHCFDKVSKEPQSIRIVLGIVRLTDLEKGNMPWQTPAETKKKSQSKHRLGEKILYLSHDDLNIHSAYAGGCQGVGRCTIRDFNADVAILKLPSSVQTNRYVRTLCLPNKRILSSNLGNLDCRVAGWGNTRVSGSVSYPRYLRWAMVSILDTDKCNKSVAYRNSITNNMLCAGKWEGGVDTCHGDSGGPLMCRLPNSPWMLMGITSTGKGCAQPMSPGVYTKLSSPIINNWLSHFIQ